MIARIRRWWQRCFPRSSRPETPFLDEMRSARAYGITQQREAHRIVRALRHEYGEGDGCG